MPASASPPQSPPVRTPGQQPSHPASATNRSPHPPRRPFRALQARATQTVGGFGLSGGRARGRAPSAPQSAAASRLPPVPRAAPRGGSARPPAQLVAGAAASAVESTFVEASIASTVGAPSRGASSPRQAAHAPGGSHDACQIDPLVEAPSAQLRLRQPAELLAVGLELERQPRGRVRRAPGAFRGRIELRGRIEPDEEEAAIVVRALA